MALSAIGAGHLPSVGRVVMAVSEHGVCRVWLPGSAERPPSACSAAGSRASRAHLAEALADLERFARGQPLRCPVDRMGWSPFQCQVADLLLAIPRGGVLTYGELARRLGRPGAARAVGRACAANPVPLWVPCHRVVAARGPGGFSAGLPTKVALLALEARLQRGLDPDQFVAVRSMLD